MAKMTVKQLKNTIKDFDDETIVFIKKKFLNYNLVFKKENFEYNIPFYKKIK